MLKDKQTANFSIEKVGTLAPSEFVTSFFAKKF
jgi:hypothetical protein